jgi:hypothetical protein
MEEPQQRPSYQTFESRETYLQIQDGRKRSGSTEINPDDSTLHQASQQSKGCQACQRPSGYVSFFYAIAKLPLISNSKISVASAHLLNKEESKNKFCVFPGTWTWRQLPALRWTCVKESLFVLSFPFKKKCFQCCADGAGAKNRVEPEH